MGDEPYLERLIGVLEQLRDRVIEVKAGRPAENNPAIDLELSTMRINLELSTMHLEAVNINNSLRTRLPETFDVVDDALSVALQAIVPDYSIEAIDNAIRVAESQRDCQ